MNCKKCGIIIPQERLDVIKTEFCVNCSCLDDLYGVTVWNKNVSELFILNKPEAERHWKLEKIDGCFSRF